MDESKKEEVANDCLAKARNYAALKNWKRSFPHYLMCLELYPNVKHNYEEEFTTVLFNLGLWLADSDRVTDLCKCYTQGLRYFPANVHVLNNFGAHLLRLNESETALKYLQLAHTADPSFLLAEKNLQTAKLNIIPRWHFRMLNDRKRNEAYRTAIHNAITAQHNKVLDIGSGCGLLSFYASECKNAKSIVAIDSCASLCRIAQEALSDRVRVIMKDSTELTSADIGLSNLLITEIFDAALFGEHLLETLIHAWDNLLEPSAIIVPCSADLFVTGISSKTILSRHKFCYDIPQLNLSNICIRQRSDEPYEAENLKDKSVKYVTDTHKVLDINFSNIEQLKTIYNDLDGIPVVTLKCIESGRIDTFVIWFDLHLDAQVTITTNPKKDSVTCWEQAVIYLNHPIDVENGQEITLRLSCVKDKLKIDVLNHPVTCQSCYEVSQEMITFLNDVQMLEAAEDLDLPARFNNKPCHILDLNPFPVFAMIRAKMGFPAVYNCVVKTEEDYKFLDFVWRHNGFCALNEFVPGTVVTFKICYAQDLEAYLTDKCIDVVYAIPVSKNGTPCEEMFDVLENLAFAVKEDALILPRDIKLQMEIIDSKYLDFCNKVDDKNLFGFKVADAVNRYAVLEQWQVEPQYYQRTTLRNFVAKCNGVTNDPIPVALVDYAMNIPIGGIANGVLYWYIMEFSENVHINTYKSLHCNGACFLFDRPRKVNPGDTLLIHVEQQKGHLKIYCGDEDD